MLWRSSFVIFCQIFFFLINLFIYFWLHWVFIAAHRLFSNCGEQGLLFVVVHGLIAVASFVVEHGLQVRRLLQLWHMGSVVVACGLSSCGSRALERRLSSCGHGLKLLRGMWDLPGPGLEPASPALAGRFLIHWQADSPPGEPLGLS